MTATKVIMSYPWKSRTEVDGSRQGSCLRDEVKAVAKRELREDDMIRRQAIQQFVEWILKNKDLSDCRTDSNFLLRFLRVKKFSLPMAQDMLLKYLNLRQTFSHLLTKLDCFQPAVAELINKGYLFPSPIRDANGRKVVIGVCSSFDPYKYSNVDMAKVHMMTYEALLEDEETQVTGVVHVGDLRGVNMAYVSLWSPAEFATVFKWGEHSLPMRHKEVHLLYVPAPLKYVYDFVRGRLSQKIRDRFTFYATLEEMHTKVDPKTLPKEYGGVIPMADMIEQWKQELLSKRDRLMDLDSMKLLDNSCVMKKDRNNNANKKSDISNVTGSFRRLDVD
ncbi:hypothetical protein AAG570_004475 [Ranatra chinensis]|uniref:CRAL-TRIO domain-containing protein n=1 Tax=Ranatra chinensis TaxID=642074 RepID=A0ABD0YFN7_9HEMI